MGSSPGSLPSHKAEPVNSGSPRIAVVIPAYNSSAYIAAALDSILSQSRPADEIMVVDDGSTDDTAAVAAGVNSKVVVVRQKNAGSGSARRCGMEATTAEWLLFLDADDILCQPALEKLLAALRPHPTAALAYCTAELWSPGADVPSCADTLGSLDGNNAWGGLLYRNSIRTPGCVLIRRAALVEAGGWGTDPELKGNEDWELWLRLAENRPFVPVREPLLKYRVHSQAFSSDRRKMYRSMFAIFSKQRSRWKGSPARRRAVDAGEWHNCKYVLNEIWSGARSACARGQLVSAASLLMDAVRLGARPLFTRVLNVGSASR